MNRKTLLILGSLLLFTWVLALWLKQPGTLWPPVVALVVILVTRSALTGLIAGGLAGAVIVTGGNFLTAVPLATGLLWESLHSSWKLGALLFTILLGGFAAVLESAGGLERMLRRWASGGHDAARSVESAAGMLGLLCFFDGLANSMVVGRVSREMADTHGVARVKLAYIVDSTSSAVACVAVVSTWIAFQLTMIGDAFAQAGREVNPYAVFLASLPANFYCWFTLAMLFVAIRNGFHPGPMGSLCHAAKGRGRPDSSATDEIGHSGNPVLTALTPLGVLLGGFLVGFVVLGTPGPILPLTRDKIVSAFGSDMGPQVLVLASVLALIVALAVHPGGLGGRKKALAASGRGMVAMLPPILILLAAWVMGGVMGQLGTAQMIVDLVAGTKILPLLPTLTFITGALVSFSTGTSWGTMGILFPLTIPAAAALGADGSFLNLMVAAVFSGAVFGDHCSPFSDTTIVTSLSCGVTPHDHVRTQLPYALLTALIAIGMGFLPAGYGWPVWLLLLGGVGMIFLLPSLWVMRPSH